MWHNFQYNFQNLNLFCDTYALIMLLTNYDTFSNFFSHIHHCKCANFDHKCSQACYILYLCRLQPTRVTIARYFCELAMPYKMSISLVGEIFDKCPIGRRAD